MRGKRILVYEATGSQGSPVARRLLEEDARMRALTRSPEKAGPLQEAGPGVLEGDMGDAERLRAAFEKRGVGV